MRISGEFTFAADRQAVWDLLHDPEIIRSCIKGCESLAEIEPGRYSADIVVGISAVKGRYSGTVEISEKNEPDSYRMSVTGEGRPGKIDAFGVISLTDDQSSTKLTFDGEVTTVGTLARVGSRLTLAAAKMMVNQFMKCVGGHLTGDG